MVGLGHAGPWLLGLLAAIGGNLADASDVVVPGAFIVEYDEGVDIDQQLVSVQDTAGLRMKLKSPLFNGASLQIHDVANAPQHVQLLSSQPGVKQSKVWPMHMFSVPEPVRRTAGRHAAAENVGTDGRRELVEDMFEPHYMTQVDRLRSQGVTGKGIKLAIIDTGVDYVHPALGGCFGPGCLVSFGHDLVGDDYNGNNKPVPDPDPLSTCLAHGTHIAGIIAAQPDSRYGIVGAATGVTLGMYRAFGCSHDATEDVLMSAAIMAHEDGADIITISLANGAGWSQSPFSVLLTRIVDAGVVCTVAAGNEGLAGLFSGAIPAAGKGVAAIASFDNTVAPLFLQHATYTQAGSVNGTFGFVAGHPQAWDNSSRPLFLTTTDTSSTADACDPLPPSTPDLAEYVVLVRSGTCPGQQKLRNIRQAGARYVLVVYRIPNTGTPYPVAETQQVPGFVAAATVGLEQANAWAVAVQSGQKITVALPDPDQAEDYLTMTVNKATGGLVSTFSAWGLTFDLEGKPQFGAPGRGILSTVPRPHLYDVLDGTSMACPLVAAIYALLMEARGTKDPQRLGHLLAATAKRTPFNAGDVLQAQPFPAPVVQQGTGLVQADAAAWATTELWPTGLSFNDTDHFAETQSFQIFNNGPEAVSYHLQHVPAPTVYTLNDSLLYPARYSTFFPAQLVMAHAAVRFGDNLRLPLTLVPGERFVVTVHVAPPEGLDARRLPVYSGYLAVTGSDHANLSLAYMGVAGSMKRATVLSAAATFLSTSLTIGNRTRTPTGRRFLLPPPGRAYTAPFLANVTDYPVLELHLAMGTPVLRMDVVPVSVPRDTTITHVLGLRTVGAVWNTPVRFQGRTTREGGLVLAFDGRLATGDFAPAGAYKVAIRALKIFGDPDAASEYELVETVEFGIDYMSNS